MPQKKQMADGEWPKANHPPSAINY